MTKHDTPDPRLIDQTGKRFGKSVVVRDAGKRNGLHFWVLRCDCGREREVSRQNLGRGSNGCMHCRKAHVIHMQTRTPAWNSWASIRQRCNNPKNAAYRNYGGRGIQMCPEWSASFEAFLRDMGPRPPGTSLDRINNDGNYEPENCRWATPLEQAQHTQRSHFLTYEGESLAISDWARRVGISYQTLLQRVRAGWSAHEALTTPVLRRGKTG